VIRAIIFDLDDTLVDTFATIITPLESRAAEAMVAAGMGELDSTRVRELILKLRRETPDRIEERLVEEFPQAQGKALEARRTVFTRVFIDKLRIKASVVKMLNELSTRYHTYLLTAGRKDIQNQKLDQLGIRKLFKEVGVIISRTEETKERWMASLIKGRYLPEEVIVVGNRLDNEIKAGNRLGMITVWVKYGEGSGMIPSEETGQPDYIINGIAEFPKILAEIESDSARG
jgi:putative hydrolase of the HAD superfamily